MYEHPTIPEIGMGATFCYPQDRHPYVITAITARTITVRMISTEGLQPVRECHGFPVFDHVFSTAELLTLAEGPERKAYMRKDGYYLSGGRLSIGKARYYRNWAD